MDLVAAVGKIPKEFYRNHEPLIRTAVARRWATVAFASKRAHDYRLAFNCLLHAMWWDYKWERRIRLVWFFFRSRKTPADFRSPFVESPAAKQPTCSSSASGQKNFV
jgi:hypothetical protein